VLISDNAICRTNDISMIRGGQKSAGKLRAALASYGAAMVLIKVSLHSYSVPTVIATGACSLHPALVKLGARLGMRG
jgi:hypothetical protein